MTAPVHDDAHAHLRALLEQVRTGALDVDGALRALQPTVLPPAAELGFATVDHDRNRRCGFPEVVFCQGKQPAEAAAIAREILRHNDVVLLTRAEPAHAAAVGAAFPEAVFHDRARCLTIERTARPRTGLVAIVAAGTADLPVAEEAAITADIAGARVERHFDVGIAGLHRLLARLPQIRAANVVIAIAGMEGALASVLAGQLSRPVVAVPTSVGYGASFGGLAALLAMLSACAAGVGVVNVDNGFGAGYLAALINRHCPPDPPR